MPEFRFSGTLDGVPSELRPGDGRIGSALAAAPVSVAGRALTVGQAIARAVAVITRTTTTAVPNWTAVVGDGDGGCRPADPTNPDHFGRVLGIVANGAASGNDVQIQAIGDLIGSAPHGLVLGAVVYVGLAGALVPTPPDGIQWRQIVGKASTDRSLVVALGEASLVTDHADAMIGEDGFSTPASVTEIVTGQGEKKYIRAPELGIALPQILLRQPTILLWVFDNLPALPSDPANYPAEGGLFRNGDANGYSLVRLYPAGGGVTALAQARALGLTDDLRDILTAVLLGVLDAASALPAAGASIPDEGGLFRSGDANGYTLTRIYPVR